MSARREYESEIYAPDSTDEERLLATRRPNGIAPERRLQLAVLEQAVEDLRRGGLPGQDAAYWFTCGLRGPFAFDEICEGSGFDAMAIRERLGVGVVENARPGNWEPKVTGPKPKRQRDAVRACVGCGRAFEPRNVESRYCSGRCRMRVGKRRSRAAASPSVDRTCERCGQRFEAHRSGARFCSTYCERDLAGRSA